MDWRNSRKHYTKYCSKWRKSNLGILKPNYRYFMREINKEVYDHLKVHGEEIKKNNPEIYYSLKNRKLPKKYQKKSVKNLQPVNAFLPNKSKSDNKVIKNDLIQKPKKRIINESRYIRWVNPHEPINKNKLGSSQAWRKEKKYEYY